MIPPRPTNGRHFKRAPLRLIDINYSLMASQVKTGRQESGCWHSTSGPVNFEGSEKTEYFKNEGLMTRGGLVKSVEVIRPGWKKNGPVIMILLVFMVINMNHDELTGY